MKKLIIIGTEPTSLLNFRKDLIKSMLKSGVSVTAITNKTNESELKEFVSLGVHAETVCFSRNGLNPFADIKVFFSLFLKFRAVQSDVILAYTIKPVIYGGLSARLTRTPFYALITGLGLAFQGDTLKRKLLTKLVVFLYKIALKNSKAVIFQNKDNRNVFIEKGIVPKSKTYIVDGSGVNLKKYNVENLPKGNIKFLCIARLLSEKGLREYAAAAKIVKNKFPEAQFNLVGPEESSLDAISLEEVNNWSDYVNYKGSANDVRPYIKACHVYVLPSYHEGLPRSVLEAMSMGRAILTTDAVGCKETVKEGVNGFKVPVKSVQKLAEKMVWFIENQDKIQSMGKESRRMAEDTFDVHKINKDMLRIMEIEQKK